MKTRHLITSLSISALIVGAAATSWQLVTGKSNPATPATGVAAKVTTVPANAPPDTRETVDSNSPSGLATEPAQQGEPRTHSARNLSLQPEAFKLARRLGQRFGSSQREQTVLEGTLTFGGEQRAVRISRKQSDDGERVEIALAGTQGLLTWEAAEGARIGGGHADPINRALIEQLVLDSPDQFALAQLRGAGYSTIAREVRPADVDDNYSGALWDIVRIDDPQGDAELRPQSSFRLYYINTNTGLVDRVVSQLRDETIEAEISGWIEQDGERVPSQISWTKHGQTIMQYRLTSFSHGQE